MKRVTHVIDAKLFKSTWCSLSLVLFTILAPESQAETLAIKAGHLLDVDSGAMLENKVIVIDGDKIKSISDQVPQNTKVLDWSKRWVLPGLMDAHVHLSANHDDGAYESLGISVPAQAISSVINAGKTLQAGFTTVRSAGDGSLSDIALRDAINSGRIKGPRIIAAGNFIGITGGHCDTNLLAPEYRHKDAGVADGPWAVRAQVRQNAKDGSDVIKFCASGGVLSKGDRPGNQEYTLEEMQALVEEAHKLGRKVLAHSHGTESSLNAIKAGVDSVEHASLIDAAGIALAKKRGTWLVMDIYNDEFIREEGARNGMLPESLEKEKLVAQAQRSNFKSAVKAGVKIAYGTDAGVYPHGENGKQFAWMVRYGMTPIQAIRSATMGTATLFGKESEIGSITAGKFADLIAVDSDPLKDVSVLEHVHGIIKGGELISND